MKKRIMILGAGILQKPAIDKAKEMGLEVIAADMDREAVGFLHADICLPISTIDTPRIIAAAREYRADGIMTLASDMPVRTIAAVAEELGLAGIDRETALRATNKFIMRQCLKEHGVPVPRFHGAQTYEEYLRSVRSLNAPVIVKPQDNSGSRGVYRIDRQDDMESVRYAFDLSKKHSRDGGIVVEEYMYGEEVSVEALSMDGAVRIVQITDKLTTGAPRFVEIGHSQPTHHPADAASRICKAAADAIRAIGIKDGPSHTEIIVTEDGPKIVELGARLGGDCITTHLVPLSTGIDMIECCIRIALRERIEIAPKLRMGSAIRYMESRRGTLKAIAGLDEAEKVDGVREVCVVKQPGTGIPDIFSSADRIGFVIAQAGTAAEAVRICEKALGFIKITIE